MSTELYLETRALLDRFVEAENQRLYRLDELVAASARLETAQAARAALEPRVAALMDRHGVRYLDHRYTVLERTNGPDGEPMVHAVKLISSYDLRDPEPEMPNAPGRQPSDAAEIDEAARHAAEEDAVTGVVGTPQAHVVRPLDPASPDPFGDRSDWPRVEVREEDGIDPLFFPLPSSGRAPLARGGNGTGDEDEDPSALAAPASGARPA